MSRTLLEQILLAIALGVTPIAYFVMRAGRRLALACGVLDIPSGGRKIHHEPTPLWGGLGIALCVLLSLGVGLFTGILSMPLGLALCLSVAVLLIGGLIDDRWNLSASKQIVFVLIACALAVYGGLGISHMTNPLGGVLDFTSIWWMPGALAFCWLLSVTYATKLMDGIDGLVTGQVIIGSLLIVALAMTQRFYQPSIAIMASVIAAIYAGFLPLNYFPARQFLGEAGSTLAGFLLGALAILSGAKLATALMVLSLPIVDICIVIVGRLRRGASPFKGDDTHLHHKLLKAGLDKKSIVWLLWSLMLVFGSAGLFVQTRGKVLLLICLCSIVAGLSYWAGRKSQRV